MDGGSSDNSVEIIKRYAHRLYYWKSCKDEGQSAAIAQGFEMSKGDILGWLNSDDYYLPNAISEMVEAMLRHPEAVSVYGDYELLLPDGQIELKPRISFNYKICLHAYMTVPQQSWFFRRDAYEDVGGLDRSLRYAMDYDLLLRLGRYGRIHHVRRVWATFRLSADCKTIGQYRAADLEMRKVKSRYGIDYTKKFSRKLTTKFYFSLAVIKCFFEHGIIVARRSSVAACQESQDNSKKTAESQTSGATPLEKFIRELAIEAARQNLTFLVLRNYKGLPKELRSRDIDVLVEKDKLRKGKSMLKTVSENLGLVHRQGAKLLYCHMQFIEGFADRKKELQIDLIPKLNWRGVDWIVVDGVIDRAIPYKNNIWIPHPAHECVISFCMSYLYGGFVKEKYLPSMSKQARENREEVFGLLKKIFGRKTANDILDGLIKQDVSYISQKATINRLKVLLRGFLRRPLRFIYTFCLGYLMEFRNKVRRDKRSIQSSN